MKKQTKTKNPFSGCITTNHNSLVIKFKGQRVTTGLKDNPEGRKLCQEILNDLNVKYLMNKGLTPASAIPKPQKIMVYDARDEWFEHFNKINLSTKTKKSYEYIFKLIVHKDYELNEINIKKAVENFIYARIEYETDENKYLSNTSKNIALRSFQIFLNFCYENKYLPELSLFKKYKLPVQQRKKMLYSKEEIDKLLVELKKTDTELELLYKFMLFTGSRISETLNLKWSDIDFHEMEISFPNKKDKVNIQRIPIFKNLVPVLNELLRISQKRLNPDKKEKLFKWEISSNSSLQRIIDKIQTGLGIKMEGRSFHSLRKTFLTFLAEETDLNIIQFTAIARHSSVETSRKFYIELDSKKMADKVNKFIIDNTVE